MASRRFGQPLGLAVAPRRRQVRRLRGDLPALAPPRLPHRGDERVLLSVAARPRLLLNRTPMKARPDAAAAGDPRSWLLRQYSLKARRHPGAAGKAVLSIKNS